MSDLDDLKRDAFGGEGSHSITDDNGQLAEPTATEQVPSEEETTVTETVEEPKEQPTQPQQETAETNTDVAEDEDGKKYVPEGRFKEVYAKLKEAERKLKEAPTSVQKAPMMSGISPDRSALLETELLNQTLPQFNPNSPEYSEVLDEMGAEIYQSSHRYDQVTGQVMPTITKLEAARRALDRAKKLGGFQEQARKEARIVKTQQSDTGITSSSKKVSEKNFEDMSLSEKESYLKKIGQW